jgi:glycerol-3-phosphate acyltransferase PlsY
VVAVLLMALGYLLGSVSFAYLAGRLVSGIDLRDYGSRTLGGSSVGQHVSR